MVHPSDSVTFDPVEHSDHEIHGCSRTEALSTDELADKLHTEDDNIVNASVKKLQDNESKLEEPEFVACNDMDTELAGSIAGKDFTEENRLQNSCKDDQNPLNGMEITSEVDVDVTEDAGDVDCVDEEIYEDKKFDITVVKHEVITEDEKIDDLKIDKELLLENEIGNRLNAAQEETNGTSRDVSATGYEVEKCASATAGQESTPTGKENSSSEKKFTCIECLKNFSSQSSLKNHMTLFHDRKYRCSECRKVYVYHRNLKVHMRSHSKVRPFQCEECKRTFTSMNDLRMHSKFHTRERSHNCSTCSKEFTSPESLSKHMKVHSTDRPFLCNVCGKKFFHQSNMKAHKSVHFDIKPYECSICSKRFARHANLHCHLKCHGETFACSVCKKRYNRPSDLRKHMPVHGNTLSAT